MNLFINLPKIIFTLFFFLNIIACSSSPNQEENNGGIVGVALGDSTTATVGDPAVGALIGNDKDSAQ